MEEAAEERDLRGVRSGDEFGVFLPKESVRNDFELKKRRDPSPFSWESIIGFFLIFSAGWVNILGFKYSIFDSLSYVSGRGIRIGISLFEGDLDFFFFALGTLIAFILGSYFGTLVTKKYGLGAGILLTSGFIFSAMIFFLQIDHFAFELISMAGSVLLLFSMGCLNASTSMTAIGRTTHLTGPATDIGMCFALGKPGYAFFWIIRWVGFFTGAFLAMVFFSWIERMQFPLFFSFLFPAFVFLILGLYLVYSRKIDLIS